MSSCVWLSMGMGMRLLARLPTTPQDDGALGLLYEQACEDVAVGKVCAGPEALSQLDQFRCAARFNTWDDVLTCCLFQ